ncbi:Asp-tRNA(Asn)/Glu-tRNA(Gln) amidotransferase subunit GatC [[Clostridium] innocuum]|nr:Asp-tRNA(Asn)/Glu-tRNA(Gln) amidotransferase subunit GatC [[Clostridium] innocuum]MCR0576794.1 Asp-tRNA(Asn)/Glu-tRNA(Gln) amidotransferase subunit GatC [[Clostridium] innocuum]
MEEFSAEYFKKLAHDIMFDLNDEEVSELQEEFKVLLQQIELLNGIDTEGVEEMIYPFEAETTFLREDSVDNIIPQESALLNVKSAKAGHVHVPKVVK